MDPRAQTDARELARCWQSVLGRLELELNRHNFATWLSGTRARSFDGTTLVIETRSTMACEWLDRRMRVVIERAAAQGFGAAVSAQFVVAGERTDGPATNPVAAATPPRQPEPAATAIGQVNCAYTFEDYLPTSGNQLAIDSCLALVEPEERAPSPVVVYGQPGMGKTHLLHALACRMKDRGRSVALLSAEEFTNRFLGSLRARQVEEFQGVIRNVDLLIIDDLQAIAGKKATQDELVCTMDAIANSGGYVVVASERHPFELGLPERLESRLAAGIVTRVEAFAAAERRAFVEHVARRRRVALPGWAIDRLSAVNAGSVRVLLGCINAALLLERNQKLDPRSLDASLAGVAVLDAAPVSGEQDLLERVARYFGVAVEDLAGRARSPRITEARAIAIAGLQQRGYSLPRIAAIFGNRDKSTVSTLAGRGRSLIESQDILRHLLAG